MSEPGVDLLPRATCRYDYSQDMGLEKFTGGEELTCGLPAEHHVVIFGLGEQVELVAHGATFACDGHMKIVRRAWAGKTSWLDHPVGEHCVRRMIAIDVDRNVCAPCEGECCDGR